MSQPVMPPRLSVLLASEAPVGVVLRRGPPKMVRLIMWDRARDRFEPGQWFRGKINAHCSDISPDGKYFLYFAEGGLKWAIPATGGTWTAISRLPSLTALALWAQGDTWGGGGMFLSNRTYVIYSTERTRLLRDIEGPLRRDWRDHLMIKERHGWVDAGSRFMHPRQEKRLPGGWLLKRHVTRVYELVNPGGWPKAYPHWEWADWDRHRLVWAEGGCLYAARLNEEAMETPRLLADFAPPPYGNRVD